MKKLVLFATTAHIARYIGQLAILAVTVVFGSHFDVGVLALAIAACSVPFVVLNMGMRTLILASENLTHFATYFKLRASSAFLAMVFASCAMIFIFRTPVLVLIGVLALKIGDSLLDLATAWWQRQGFLKTYLSFSLFSSGLTVIGGLTGALSASVQMAVAIAGLLNLSAAILAVTTVCFGETRTTRPKSSDSPRQSAPVLTLARQGLPLGISYAIANIISSIPQLALGASGHVTQSGRYGFFVYFVTASELFANPYTQAWISKIKLHLNGNMKISLARLVSEIVRAMAGFTPFVILLLALGVALIAKFDAYYLPNRFEIFLICLCMLIMPTLHMTMAALAINSMYRETFLSSLFSLLIALTLTFASIQFRSVTVSLAILALALIVRSGTPFVFLFAKGRSNAKQ